MNGLKILSHKDTLIKHELNIYNKPKKVYIPLISENNEDIIVFVKKDDYVFKGTMVGKKKGKFKTPIFSSVSGKVIDFEEHTIFNGEKVKCIVIENDFKEKIEKGFNQIDNLNQISKINFIEILKKCGIVELNGTGIPAYIKYNTDKKINMLIVTVSKYDCYITTDYSIVEENCEEILEAIDAVLEINKIDKAIIVIKKSDKYLLNIINRYVGTYLKIKVVIVPNSYSKYSLKKITDTNYDKFSIEDKAIVNDISTIYAIYQALKINKPMIERIVTFSGNGLKKTQNILVKIGTPVKEVINYIGLTKNNILITVKSMIEGIVDDLVVTPELNLVLVIENNL